MTGIYVNNTNSDLATLIGTGRCGASPTHRTLGEIIAFGKWIKIQDSKKVILQLTQEEIFMSKIKVVRNIVLIMVMLPIIAVGIMTLFGEGITYGSILANIRAEQAFREISMGHYEESTEYIKFWGILEEGDIADSAKIIEEKKIFTTELEDFFTRSSRELEDYRVYGFRTDDGYTTGYTELMVMDDGISYSIAFAISFSEGKICPMRIDAIMTDADGSVDIKEMPNELLRIIKTHYPG